MRIIVRILITLVVLSVAAPGAIKAQSASDEMEVLRSQLATDRKAVVAEYMGLNDAESAAFWALYDQYRAALKPLGDRMSNTITEYAKNYPNLSDAQSQAMLSDYLGVQTDKAKVMQSFAKKFAKVLSPKKVTRFYQIENKLDAIVNFGMAAEIPLVK